MASIKRKELERQLSALHSRLNEKQKKLVEIQGPAGTKTGLLGDVRAKMETIKAAMKEQQDFAESTQPKIESLISEMEKKQLRINELLKDIEYKDRAKLESHISTLEHQYNNSKMNIKDERQIVSYIDKLKRSRKKIEEFQRLELDIVSMKAERTKLRQQKGKAYSDYNHMKKQLGQLQGGYKAMRRDAKTLKMGMDELLGNVTTTS